MSIILSKAARTRTEELSETAAPQDYIYDTFSAISNFTLDNKTLCDGISQRVGRVF